MKPGEKVWVWGHRLGRVLKTKGNRGRVFVELLDGQYPPPGYSAWFPTADVGPIPPGAQFNFAFHPEEPWPPKKKNQSTKRTSASNARTTSRSSAKKAAKPKTRLPVVE